MPNWCNNSIEIYHPDRAKLDALVDSVNEGKFLNHIIPVPDSLHITAGREGDDNDPRQIALVEAEQRNIAEHGYANWYDFCVAKWGTKWDVEAYDTVDKADTVSFGFDSAWSPPIGIYEAMVEQGYKIKAFYWESGMCYCGKITTIEDGDERYIDDDYYDYSNMSAKDFAEEIDPELDEAMCIIENIEMWEEENKENEED